MGTHQAATALFKQKRRGGSRQLSQRSVLVGIRYKGGRHPHYRRTDGGLIRPAHLNLINVKEQSMTPVVIVDIVFVA